MRMGTVRAGYLLISFIHTWVRDRVRVRVRARVRVRVRVTTTTLRVLNTHPVAQHPQRRLRAHVLGEALCLVVVEAHDRPVVVDEATRIAVQHGAPISNDEGATPHVVAILVQVSHDAQVLRTRVACGAQHHGRRRSRRGFATDGTGAYKAIHQRVVREPQLLRGGLTYQEGSQRALVYARRASGRRGECRAPGGSQLDRFLWGSSPVRRGRASLRLAGEGQAPGRRAAAWRRRGFASLPAGAPLPRKREVHWRLVLLPPAP